MQCNVDRDSGDIVRNEVIEKVNQLRSRYYGTDKESLENRSEYTSVEDLKQRLSSGCFRIDINNVRYECFFHWDSYAPPKKLYVFFGGARTPMSQWNSPSFPRWSYHALVENVAEGATLCVADPMHYVYKNLSLGWYYGNENGSYLELMLDIIKGICSKYGVGNKDVVFFGSSGGGYAAIYSASLMQGTMAIAINPQFYIRNYSYAETFEKITGVDLKIEDEFCRNNVSQLIKRSDSKYFILENLQSYNDINKQLFPFCGEMGIDLVNLSYGIKRYDNVLLWLYDVEGVPDAHNVMETKNIFGAIDFIAERFKTGNISDECNDLALYVNECWCDLYKAKQQNAKEKINKAKNKAADDNVVVYLPNVPCRLNSNDIVDTIYFFRLEALNKDYNFYTYQNFSANMLYTLKLDLEADYAQCSIGLLGKNGKTIHARFYSTREQISYCFMIGDNAEEVRFVVHAGICGQSKGKSLLIKSLIVMARPLSALAEDNSENHSDSYWYDECSKALSENEWTKGSQVSLYDHHALPWRQTVVLQNLLRDRKPAAILELGLGESSKILAQYANYAGASHIIIDANPNYSRAFLQSSPAIFAKAKVHISSLLQVRKGEREYCCFQNFKKVVGSSKFGIIIQHCPRGGGNSLIYADVAMQLCDMLDNQFVILLENADTPEMHIYIDDIVVLLQKRGISAGKKYIALPQGEFCLITSANG